MSLSPEHIAQELKSYSSLRLFDDPILTQLSRLLKQVSFPAGHVLLNAHQTNDKLYFLRAGTVDIVFQGEKIREAKDPGEVIGELSALSGKPTSLLVRAQSAVQCYVISVQDFTSTGASESEPLRLLMYRLYVSVLTDRLSLVSEKAKLYEFTARELASARQELETLSARQQIHDARALPLRRRVLLLEPSRKQQNLIKAAIGGAGLDVQICATVDEAKLHYALQSPDVIFCESSLTDFLFWTQQQGFQGESVLIESGPIDFARLTSMPFVQNVISRNVEDRAATAKSVLVSLSKIVRGDYFGIEKYLAWGTEVRSIALSGSKDRALIKEELYTHFRSMGIRTPLLERLEHAAEEMMMNAVYDAPVDADGTALFNHLPRNNEIQLQSNQEAVFRFACDGNVVAISTQDPFGSLPRYVILNYLESCYSNQAGTYNAAKGGGGRGLHQILETCDWTVFNIKPGERTEVIGLFDIERKEFQWPQFHYFFLK